MESLTNVIIFHRKLGCIDESATDEEQGEKVLYFYPETSLYWQVIYMYISPLLLLFFCYLFIYLFNF